MLNSKEECKRNGSKSIISLKKDLNKEIKGRRMKLKEPKSTWWCVREKGIENNLTSKIKGSRQVADLMRINLFWGFAVLIDYNQKFIEQYPLKMQSAFT